MKQYFCESSVRTSEVEGRLPGLTNHLADLQLELSDLSVSTTDRTNLMKALYLSLVFFVLAAYATADEPVRERIEWIDIWVTDADKDELPRVLLVGDSIARGYFGGVEKQLAGKAYCARLTTSKCVSDSTFDDDLRLLLKQYRFSVIHINNGLHGWGYSEEQYRDGLARTLETLSEHGQGAKIMWATTTPVREKSDLKVFADRTDRVRKRNMIAAELIKGRGVVTNDLLSFVESHPEWASTDGVHFNGQGNEALAAQVAERVLPFLSSAR